MPNVLFVGHFVGRILRGERFRRATPEELRTDGAALSTVVLVGLVYLSIGSQARLRMWTLPPAVLWACVVPAFFPLAAFLLWARDRVPGVWSIGVSVAIGTAVFAHAVLCPRGVVSASTVAQAGILLHVALMIAGAAIP